MLENRKCAGKISFFLFKVLSSTSLNSSLLERSCRTLSIRVAVKEVKAKNGSFVCIAVLLFVLDLYKYIAFLIIGAFWKQVEESICRFFATFHKMHAADHCNLSL